MAGSRTVSKESSRKTVKKTSYKKRTQHKTKKTSPRVSTSLAPSNGLMKMREYNSIFKTIK